MIINPNPSFGLHNTSTRSGAIEYIVIHYIGATGDAKANINYYNQKTVNTSSADFYVGHSGDVWQYNPNPKTRYCWAVGGKKQSTYGGTLYGVAKNSNCVSIEMCVKNSTGDKTPNSKGWYFTEDTVKATIELTKHLMKEYNIPASRVIRHFDVNGKFCPGVVGWNAGTGDESDWNDFKKQISSSTTVKVEAPTKTEVKLEANNATEKQNNIPNAPFKVKVLITDLNRRKTASSKGEILGVAEKGTLNIVEVKNGWGKIKGNKGWIYLKNANYVQILESTSTSNTFKVRVTANALHIRAGAGKNHTSVGVIRDKGVYSILEEKNGWGRLKSDAGWICLEYTKKV